MPNPNRCADRPVDLEKYASARTKLKAAITAVEFYRRGSEAGTENLFARKILLSVFKDVCENGLQEEAGLSDEDVRTVNDGGPIPDHFLDYLEERIKMYRKNISYYLSLLPAE